MEILSLTDNLCALPGYKAQHGLSLYIKTQKHMILFDLGQDSTFIRNARKLESKLSACGYYYPTVNSNILQFKAHSREGITV